VHTHGTLFLLLAAVRGGLRMEYVAANSSLCMWGRDEGVGGIVGWWERVF